MLTDQFLVSIIIRARNEEVALRRLVPLLRRQQTDFAYEIWLLDNASTDSTAAFAREHGLCYHVIPEGTFNYASALNDGAALARGAIVVNLSAHCFPTSVHWLARLVAPLRDDAQVVASYGSQWTNPRFNAIEALGNGTLYPEDHDQPEIIAFSNANGAVRRDVLLQHPFNPGIRIMEDHLFYLELRDTFRFVYVPQALVYHEQAGLEEISVRRWEMQGWALFFLTRHRKLTTPFMPPRLISVWNLLRGYPLMARAFYRQGNRTYAALAVPFMWLRDAMWVVGWLRAWRNRRRIAQEDAAMNRRSQAALPRQAVFVAKENL